jgi:hypothetical protein
MPARQARPFLEPLEPRILLSAVVAHWIGGASGNWSNPANWDMIPEKQLPKYYRICEIVIVFYCIQW